MLNTFPLKGLPAAVCTIYGPRYPDPVQHRVGTERRSCHFLAARPIASVGPPARDNDLPLTYFT